MMKPLLHPLEEADTMSDADTLRARLDRLGRESAYLFGTFPLAVLGFCLSVSLFAAGVGTVIVWVGLPILTVTLLTVGGFAALERRFAEKASGRPMPDPHYLAADPGASLLRRMGTTLRDPQRWFELLWSVVHFVVSTVTFSVAVSWWAAALWLPFGPLVNGILDRAIPGRGPNIGGLAGLPWPFSSRLFEYGLAVVFLLTLPAVVRGLARLQTSVSHALLCSRSALEARIDDLRDSREAARGAEARALHRLERDIHDGPQQRLVRLQLDLARAERAAASDPGKTATLLADARVQTAETLAELRHLSRGIAPPVLVDRGLDAALDELAARSEVPCTIDARTARTLPQHVAATAYFVAAEALTNVNKHALASGAHVYVKHDDDLLVVAVSDDGVGGASAAKGHGLSGLAQRLRGVDGYLEVNSPAGGPTMVQAWIPCAS